MAGVGGCERDTEHTRPLAVVIAGGIVEVMKRGNGCAAVTAALPNIAKCGWT